MNKLRKIIKGLVCVFPVVMYFSYYPIISFGATGTMNFELSLPLIWLVAFDILATVLVVKLGKAKVIAGKWYYYLFPFFATLSVFWSRNPVRGALTLGVMWAIIIAVMALVILKKEIFDAKFRKTFWKWFFGASLVIVVWCVVQCILDVAGVGRDYTLMCLGCTSKSFGFPHPNGFAIEPQFMGNLLLAPAIISGVFLTGKPKFEMKKSIRVALFLVFAGALFLTFSRGAIYAFVVAMIFLTTMRGVQAKSWKPVMIWPLIIVAFVVTLNIQGLMAQLSSTNDTYYSGVRKAISQLTLGKIELPGNEETSEEADSPESGEMQISEDVSEEDESAFDGYVEESTNVRMMLTGAAVEEWMKSPGNVLVGVGIGGAGQALYEDGLIASPKEIVQNEYASLLVETGSIGILLLVISVAGLLMELWKTKNRTLIFALVVSYGVSLLFFSGFANAVHIYLLPAILALI